MTERKQIIENLDRQAKDIITVLGVNPDEEMKKLEHECSDDFSSEFTRTIGFLMNYLVLLNKNKCPDIDGVINPIITPDMVSWYQETFNRLLEWKFPDI